MICRRMHIGETLSFYNISCFNVFVLMSLGTNEETLTLELQFLLRGTELGSNVL